MGSKRWLITGVASGLGQELARVVLSRGDAVVGGSQDGRHDLPFSPGQLSVLSLELLDAASIGSFVDAAFAGGEVDVIANVAGYGLIGAVEDATDSEVREIFDVNFFGPLRLIQLALPRLRTQGRGHIVNITSIAGRAPAAGSGVYAASKFALEGLSASLAQELAPFGIRVTAVAPGALRTPFLSPHAVRRSKAPDAAYAASVGTVLGVLDSIAGCENGDPARAATAIVSAIGADDPPRSLLLGSDALRRMRARRDEETAEMKRWEDVTVGVDFSPASQ